MARERFCGGVLLLPVMWLLTAGLPAPAAEAPPAGEDQTVKDARELAQRINQSLEARWVATKVTPAAATGDAEFLRRVYLDLVGTIPSVGEVRAFLTDPKPDKRERLVERLLRSPGYATHFSRFWRSVMLPENANVDNLGLRFSFEAWLRSRLQANTSYDRMVREILTSTPMRGRRGEVPDQALLQANAGQISPLAFALANENKPENLAGSTARLFLGLRLECAQCHNHPHASWKQEQFWEYAAFFGGTQRNNTREIAIPKLARTVQARFPDGTQPTWKNGSPATVLADWMTREDNPYFARAVVNRLWEYFLGNGLVEPVDDLGQESDNNALLDELARDFVKHQYDLKYLIRAIVLSRAYQLSSVAARDDEEDVRVFARMPVRALAPEQLIASLVEATGSDGFTQDLEARFARQNEKATEVQTSILQALALMNGPFVDDATSLEQSQTLAAVATAPFLDSRGKIEVLYLAALSRQPRPEETARLVKYLEKGGPSSDQQRALADVFWTLLNSGEFFLNH